MNSGFIDYESDVGNPSVNNHTEMYSIPLSLDVPQETFVTLSRNKFIKP